MVKRFRIAIMYETAAGRMPAPRWRLLLAECTPDYVGFEIGRVRGGLRLRLSGKIPQPALCRRAQDVGRGVKADF